MIAETATSSFPHDEAIARYSAFVEKHLKRNFWLNIGDGICFFVSTTFISMETMVPVLISRLGGSSLMVALVPFFFASTMGLGPFLVARYVEQLDMKRRAVVFWGAAMRLPLLAIGALILMLGAGHNRLLLGIVICGFLLYYLFGAISVSPYYDLVAKVIPLRVRGRMLSMRTMGGYAVGILSGIAATKILSALPFPLNFGVVFVIAFFFSVLSLFFFAAIREAVYPLKPKETGRREYARNLLQILRTDRKFLRFIASRVFLVLASSGNAFFAVYGINKFNLSDAYAGVFTLIGVVTCILASPAVGIIGDKIGHKVNLLIALASPALAAIIAIHAANLIMYCLTFCFINIMMSAMFVSVMNMTVEYCKPQERPTYIGLAGLLVMPFTLFTLFMGKAADMLGYPALFGIIAAVSLAGFVYTAVAVVDPTKAAHRLRDPAEKQHL